MRASPLVVLIVCGLADQATSADKTDDTAKVEGVLIVAKDEASFKGHLIEIRLFRVEPDASDKPGELVDKLDIKDFEHVNGVETRKDFALGGKQKLDPKMTYFLRILVNDGKNITHLGECDHAPKKLPRVLTFGQPRKVTVRLKPR
jgi:hypothetical protein